MDGVGASASAEMNILSKTASWEASGCARVGRGRGKGKKRVSMGRAEELAMFWDGLGEGHPTVLFCGTKRRRWLHVTLTTKTSKNTRPTMSAIKKHMLFSPPDLFMM